ncbi:ribonuclease HII [Candidatus Micrarchaeota archaeon]|nr:ribonuclease HII [Candidatus Micrarchaeota archaeon]
MALIGGIDEAGRGPVIGPLVICLATAERKDEQKIKQFGAVDSKKLSPEQREAVLAKITSICNFVIKEITAQELNRLMDDYSLNEIEEMAMAELIKKTRADVIVDLPERYSWVFFKRMKSYGVEKVEAEHHADDKYPIVSAASICAKVTRDKRIEELRNQYGDFGSGYPADPKTIAFIKNPEKRNLILKYIRIKWKTISNLSQTKLF